MALTIAQKIEKQRLQQKRAQERARAKKSDPVEQAKLRKKQLDAAERARIKRLTKVNSPEYKKQLKEKQIERMEKAKAKPRKLPVKKSNRGLKGRAITAKERHVMDCIGKLPCIACLKHGRQSPIVSLHHIDGRTKEHAHALVLPLCAWHHDTLIELQYRDEFPDMLPVHAKGKYGGKAQFAKYNGTEMDLLDDAYTLAGLFDERLIFIDRIIPNR